MAMEPLYQGDLDTWCGIYAIVNAIRFIDKEMKGEKTSFLFRRILRYLERMGRLRTVSSIGIPSSDMSLVIREMAKSGYGITVTRPFYRTKKVSLDQVMEEIDGFLTEAQGRVVVASVGGKGMDDWSHWTVISRITKKEIHFFDSGLLTKLRREKCTTATGASRKPYLLDKKDIFFLSKQ